MKEKQRLLIALGAAAAVNCLPCSEHIMAAAQAAGISPEEMEEAWQISQKVKSGADEVTQSWLREQLGHEGEKAACTCASAPIPSSCALSSKVAKPVEAVASGGSCCG